MITVSKAPGADYTTISDAVSYLEAEFQKDKVNWKGAVIQLKAGIYEERVEIRIPKLTIIGEQKDTTIITGNLYAMMYCEDIGKLGTFRTYTVMVDADEVHMSNLTISNTAGYGDKIGQAIALHAEGDKLRFENCRFLGFQDTLYTGPLPPKEVEKNGFVGPKQYEPRRNGRQYYKDCYIEGTVDFIFGSATAYFEHCTIFQKDIGQPVNSYATAASTAEGETYGYVFNDCEFTGNAPASTCFLGRPWRCFAQTVIMNSYLGEQLVQEGWDDWGKADAHVTALYAEYKNYGPGNQPEKRPCWIHYLTDEDAVRYTRQNVLASLAGRDDWDIR